MHELAGYAWLDVVFANKVGYSFCPDGCADEGGRCGREVADQCKHCYTG